jgi:hypothetical protein
LLAPALVGLRLTESGTCICGPTRGTKHRRRSSTVREVGSCERDLLRVIHLPVRVGHGRKVSHVRGPLERVAGSRLGGRWRERETRRRVDTVGPTPVTRDCRRAAHSMAHLPQLLAPLIHVPARLLHVARGRKGGRVLTAQKCKLLPMRRLGPSCAPAAPWTRPPCRSQCRPSPVERGRGSELGAECKNVRPYRPNLGVTLTCPWFFTAALTCCLLMSYASLMRSPVVG